MDEEPECTCPTLINGHHPGCPYAAALRTKKEKKGKQKCFVCGKGLDELDEAGSLFLDQNGHYYCDDHRDRTEKDDGDPPVNLKFWVLS